MITREDLVVQSAENYVTAQLALRGYTADNVTIRDAFPSVDERATELEKTTIATGFNFDDGGRRAEMGSDLLRRVYSIEFWTFGTTPEYGQNVAHVIRAVFENDGIMPLQDIREDGDPVIDALQLDEPRGVIVTRQIARDPRPWEMYVWTTTVKLEDFYFPSEWD